MKKILKKIVITVVSLIALLTIVNWFTDREIKTEIVINASTEEIWDVLLNHKEYPEWNPFIKKISGSVVQGENLAVTIQTENNKPMDFTPIVLMNKENEEFRWKGKLIVNGVFDGEHYFTVEKIETNRVKFIQGENFSGILSGLFMLMIREDTEGGFKSMNMALKNRVESNQNRKEK